MSGLAKCDGKTIRMGFLFDDDFMRFYKDATEYVYIIYTLLIVGNGVML